MQPGVPIAADLQHERFHRLAADFEERLTAVRPLEEPAFVRADWSERNAALAADLLPRPAPDFLSHPAIRFQMFVDERYLAHEAPYVTERLPHASLAREDPVGGPPRVGLPGHDILTSSNTMHQLHHLLRYEDATGRAVAESETIVEWGGGYGSLAKLLLRLHGGAPTYVLVDTPVFAAVQWLYLAAVLGEERVVLHDAPGAGVVEGAVNVVPLGLVTGLEVETDLFVSTWALNESTPAAQSHVAGRAWFGADALLLAMHHGDPLETRVLDAGARPVALGDFMPGQHYFVR